MEWFGGGKKEDMSGSGQGTLPCPHGRPALGYIASPAAYWGCAWLGEAIEPTCQCLSRGGPHQAGSQHPPECEKTRSGENSEGDL